jgi:glutamine synthetase
MGNYTREEVLQMAEDEDVEFIRLQFTDMFGTLKNIAITARELPRALSNKYMIDGSFVAGISSEQEPDMVLHPDLGTFAILPWRPQQGKVARMLCDIYKPDGTPFVRSSRYILKKVADEAEAQGYTCYIDPECEFFLFHTDDNGMPTTVTHEKAGYLDISPIDFGENARRDMVLNLEDMGFAVESSHHETAPAQHEIDFRYAEVKETADCIMTFKMAVRTIAKRHGLHATFMPKPKSDENGSGMHIHFSLFKNGRNIFVDPDDESELSEEAYYFVGGLLAHSREMALITNPLVNSYKRLVPGYEAPTELTWTKNNQNSLVRIPGNRGAETRIELRSPDAASNPYLVFAVCLAAGLDGIRRKLYPTKSSNRSLSQSDQKAMNIENLPENLKEAIELFEESDWIKEVLGKEFCEEYVAAKKKEWLRYVRQVSEWEIEEYLYRI